MDELAPSSLSLSERVSQALASLSPSEARVAQYLKAMPAEDLIFTNAEELGRLTKTSDATVIRTARKLGYTGLPQLKREAANTLGTNTDPKDQLSKKLAALGSDIGSMRRQIFADAAESMELSENALDDAELQRAVGAIAHAGSILVYGYGGSELGARHLARMANRMGYNARAIGDTGLMLADSLISISRGDAVVIFQTGRRLRDIDVLLECTAAVGATSILVSGEPLHEQLAGAYDIGLLAIRGSAKLSAEALGPIVVADVIGYGLSALDEQRAMQTREQLTYIRQQLIQRKT